MSTPDTPGDPDMRVTAPPPTEEHTESEQKLVVTAEAGGAPEPSVQQSDPRILDECCRAYYQWVLQRAQRKLPREDAYDLTQDVFAALADYYAKNGDVPDDVQSWIHGTTSHMIANFYRRRNRLAQAWLPAKIASLEQMVEEEINGLADASPMASPEQEVIWGLTEAEIRQAIARLPSLQRAAMENLIQGISSAEQAQHEGLSNSSGSRIRQRVCRARQALLRDLNAIID